MADSTKPDILAALHEEHAQLKDRCDNLYPFIASEEFELLDQEDKLLLNDQIDAMMLSWKFLKNVLNALQDTPMTIDATRLRKFGDVVNSSLRLNLEVREQALSELGGFDDTDDYRQ